MNLKKFKSLEGWGEMGGILGIRRHSFLLNRKIKISSFLLSNGGNGGKTNWSLYLFEFLKKLVIERNFYTIFIISFHLIKCIWDIQTYEFHIQNNTTLFHDFSLEAKEIYVEINQKNIDR